MPCGVIDFGDVTRTLRVCELAVAASIALRPRPGRPDLRRRRDRARLRRRLPARRRRAGGAPAPDRGARRDRRGRHRAAGGARAAQRLRPARARGRLGDLRGRGEACPRTLAEAAFRLACGRGRVAARAARARRDRWPLPASRPAPTSTSRPRATRSPTAPGARPPSPRWRTRRARRHGEARLYATRERLERRARDDPPRPRPLRTRPAARCGRRSPGRVERVGAGELVLAADGLALRLAGLAPVVWRRATSVAAGDVLGHLRGRRRCRRTCTCRSRRPALRRSPGLATPALAAAWLALCPHPGPLLGLAGRRAGPSALLAAGAP